MKRIGIIVAGSAYPMDGFKFGLQFTLEKSLP